jgi:hypothetical protein
VINDPVTIYSNAKALAGQKSAVTWDLEKVVRAVWIIGPI